MKTSLNDYSAECHKANRKWWEKLVCIECNCYLVNGFCTSGGKCSLWGEKQEGIYKYSKDRNKGELIALIHSEISEAMEGERKNLMDDKLPNRKMAEVELADCLIRIFDYCGAFGYDLQGAYEEKMAYNAQREDHKHEARELNNGKKW